MVGTTERVKLKCFKNHAGRIFFQQLLNFYKQFLFFFKQTFTLEAQRLFLMSNFKQAGDFLTVNAVEVFIHRYMS